VILINMMFHKNKKIAESAASSLSFYMGTFNEMGYQDYLNKFKRKQLVQIVRGIIQGI